MKTCPPCENPKAHYWDETHAQMVLALIKTDPDPWREYNPCRVIRCDWCDHWVLTSKPKSGPRMTTRKPTQRGRRSWSGSRKVGRGERSR